MPAISRRCSSTIEIIVRTDDLISSAAVYRACFLGNYRQLWGGMHGHVFKSDISGIKRWNVLEMFLMFKTTKQIILLFKKKENSITY